MGRSGPVEHMADVGYKYKTLFGKSWWRILLEKRLVEELITKFILNKFREGKWD
jgi:hypothetical protein